jgi:site-specific DNA recombinase
VLVSVCKMLRDRSALIGLLAVELDAEDASAMLDQSEALAKTFETGSSLDQRALFSELDVRLVVDGNLLDADIDLDSLGRQLGVGSPTERGHRYQLDVPNRPRRRAREIRLVIPRDNAKPVHRDGRLVALLLKAKAAQQQLLAHGNEGTPSIYSGKHVTRLARLAWFAPDIVSAILDGSAPRALTARRLLRAAEVPLAWADQRRAFGFV